MRSSATSNRSRGTCSRLRKNTARNESASRPPISQIQTTFFNAPRVCPRSFSCALTCCSAMVVAVLNECDNGASRESAPDQEFGRLHIPKLECCDDAEGRVAEALFIDHRLCENRAKPGR